ncbi:hypothetical protein J4E83_002391 [Alternaria metachromatica]|uniref:uncharacterized protein n=1 Tax=Alternaria metachromatica TaxID=283354 RepID=UPI0020C41836|nr:uncharacterized protein J4E83_002391 [Alternaria metachromatica]KAI4630867.1 hypothetical protein J4E83_002391 [Alternaria metachromatica]
MQESLDTARVQAVLCDMSDESQRLDMFMWTGVIYSMAVVFVVLRIVGKLVNKRLAMDDYIVVFALVLCAVPAGCTLAMTERGFGEHLWNLEDGALSPILRYFYISWSTYIAVLGLIKLSLIAFYLEIFQTKSFRITAYIFGAGIIINSTVIVFLTIFICTPVESFWNRDIKGQCLDIQAVPMANSISAIVQDILLLILPLFFIRNLQMRRYKKVAVCFMFAIGTFGCIATIIRLFVLLTFKISVDPTWDYVKVTVWTELELAAGFACVSLPSIRILVVRMLPKNVIEFFTEITQSSKQKNSDPKNVHAHAAPVEQPGKKEWRKPAGWDWVSLGAEESDSPLATRKSMASGRWPWVATSPLTSRFSTHPRGGSRLLSSAMSNHSDTDTRIRAWSAKENEAQKNAMELREVPQNEIEFGDVCVNIANEVTALPKIGCLPERSYSHEHERTRGSKWLFKKQKRSHGEPV